ncbi:hypothetical protein C1646_762798 [Rhizophagus diaphanus]|nr:hypothetical protein C1646_762798 [Rhizophagus diaphanus] [Rhizophagus sp. MUCL 43196]
MSVNEANPFELEVLRQRIIDLEAENSKIKVEKAELEAKNAEHLKQVMDDNAKLKTRIEELEKYKRVTTKLKSENTELKARVAKLKEDYRLMQNNITTIVTGPSNNDSPNFNSDILLSKELIPEVLPVSSKISEKKEMDAFLVESLPIPPEEERLQVLDSDIHDPKRVSGGSRSHKKKGIDELKHELFNPSLESEFSSSINLNSVTEISEMTHPGKVTYNNINEASQHLAQLCDKAIDAEDRAN